MPFPEPKHSDPKYEPLSPSDHEGVDDHERQPRIRRSWLSWSASMICVLSMGWLATVVAWYHSHSISSNGPLHVYTNTPIPKEVFKPVKRVFEPDERYVGGGSEVEAMWDQLVAGACTSLDATFVCIILNADNERNRS